MNFENPSYFWLLLLLIPIAVWLVLRVKHNDASLQISSVAPFAKTPKPKKIWLYYFPFTLIAVVFMVITLARPQRSDSFSSETTEGINIMLALDISGTMLASDLRPNRLDAAKNVATEFILSRPNDNMGLVIFAGESFTQCPITSNHAALINLLKNVEYGMIEDGTAIGLGLANAVNRIKDSEAKSKVIILLTDCTNNRGDIAPITAAEIAQTFGLRVYTIGVGTRGIAKMPMQDVFGNTHYVDTEVDIDETTLQRIASMTGGKYFRATDNNSLKSIYQEIDKMEKTKLHTESYSRKTEKYLPFLLIAFGLLALELLVRITILRRLP
ncbi:MAG: VWA domain-containing protein [Prevotellaceae bacterium]|jgi:Ca-activated chloride channel family protein|nr:VWA domain-containing protein [Prevotellaceae bacterium]